MVLNKSKVMKADANEVNMPENQFYRLNKSRLVKTTKINMECPRRVEYWRKSLNRYFRMRLHATKIV